MDGDARHAAVVESLKATASELQARPSEEMNRDWADRMADGLAAAGLLAAPAAQDPDYLALRTSVAELEDLLVRAGRSYGENLDSLRALAEKHVNETSTGGYIARERIPGETYRDATASAAPPAPFTDLTARLAAADQGWAMQHHEPPSSSDYIRFLAAQVDAFEGVASPAAPADDEATVERVAKAIRAADLRAGASNVAYWTLERLDEEWATNCGPEWQEKHRVQARAALAALREGQ